MSVLVEKMRYTMICLHILYEGTKHLRASSVLLLSCHDTVIQVEYKKKRTEEGHQICIISVSRGLTMHAIQCRLC